MPITTEKSFCLIRYDSKSGWGAPLPTGWNSASTLVLAFGASGLPAVGGPLADLKSAFPDSHIVGCSTSGEIHGSQLVDDGMSVALFRFRSSRLRSASAPVRSPEDSRRCGELLAQQLAGPDLAGVLVYSDGLHVNGTELVAGLSGVLGHKVVITGGLAGDGAAFKRTWVVRNAQAAEGFVVAVGVYGSSARFGHGSKGGWDPFGPERIITRSNGNVLLELDGQPALELYKKYLGDRADGLPATALLFPLSVRSGASTPLVRTILSVDEAAQSLTFAGDVPQGATAQLMRANFDRLINGAGAAAIDCQAAGDRAPRLAIAVSCIGRRLVLGERAEEELEAVWDHLPPGSTVVGFYSYGEIAPTGAGPCDLHNQTMTLTTIWEAPDA